MPGEPQTIVVATRSEPSRAGVRVRAYSRTAIVLHWLIAIMILTNFTLGANMVGLHMSPEKLRLYSYHKWIGITVLGLALVRSVWRLTHPVPPDEPMPRWQRAAARTTHALLYVLMLAVPLLGWISSSADGYPVVYLKLWQLPDLVPRNPPLGRTLENVHGWLGWTLFYIVLLHLAGALKHHFIDRDATLRRMFRWNAQRGDR